jgi:sulfate transport system permease protein
MSFAIAGQPMHLRRNPLPGFAPTLGLTIFVISTLIVIPLAGLFAKAAAMSLAQALALLETPRVAAAFRLSFGLSFLAAVANGLTGMLIAWVLVRYDFPGRRILDALVDLPFALPTAVAGISLTALYADNGWIGAPLARIGIEVAFTPLGIFMALLFVGLPYTIRTVQPVLADLEYEVEEAALTLGARAGHIFRRIVLPQLLPAMLAGVAMAFARGVGEYGSVIFIAGNMPNFSEIVPLLIVIRLQQFDYAGAALLAVIMLTASLAILLLLNALAAWRGRYRD